MHALVFPFIWYIVSTLVPGSLQYEIVPLTHTSLVLTHGLGSLHSQMKVQLKRTLQLPEATIKENAGEIIEHRGSYLFSTQMDMFFTFGEMWCVRCFGIKHIFGMWSMMCFFCRHTNEYAHNVALWCMTYFSSAMPFWCTLAYYSYMDAIFCRMLV